MQPTCKELLSRRARVTNRLSTAHPGWQTAVITSKVNQYYLTGTMGEGAVLLRQDGKLAFFVRASYHRACEESPLQEIHPMRSFRDAAQKWGGDLGHTLVETDTLTLSAMARMQKYLNMERVAGLDIDLRRVRAVKSPLEIMLMERAGKLHKRLFAQRVPALLQAGITEAQLVGDTYSAMMDLGHQGLARFTSPATEMAVGQIAFGTHSLVPTSFDGPGGSRGDSPAVPAGGDPSRRLRRGELVFADIAFGVGGYHSDKTQVYWYGGAVPAQANQAHALCMAVMEKAAAQLRPGAIPSEIYKNTVLALGESEREHFMGFGDRRVPFLGHGIGLQVDEWPVIAKGFDEPLQENMVLALEPKKGVPDIGMVGVEETFVVTPEGGRCITGGPREIIAIQ